MKVLIWLFSLVSLLVPTALLAQATPMDPCNARPAAAKYFLAFDQFQKQLRTDLTRQDAVALAFLVKFPLHINEAGGGMISLLNAAALKSDFQEIFTPAVRQQVLNETSDDAADVNCDDNEVSLAQGVLWVAATDRGYAISAVSENGIKTPETFYACQTQTHRIVVDTMAGGGLRYRSWNKPRPVTDTPDLTLEKGEFTVEGNRCGTPVYTFKNGTAQYRVYGSVGCYASYPPQDAPPKDSTGQLQVTVTGKPTADSWCY